MLHRVVREHLESLLAECAARSATGRGYPAHVQDEFRRYSDVRAFDSPGRRAPTLCAVPPMDLHPHDRDRFELLMSMPSCPADGRADGRADDRAGEGDGDTEPGTSTEYDAGGHRAASRRHWATLLPRVFQTDALFCPSCKGPRRILAALTEREPIDKILTHLGPTTEVPIVEKARPPPQSDFAFEEPC